VSGARRRPYWLLALGLGACVTGDYSRVSFNEPVDAAALRSLAPGQDDLTSVLAKLGAPVDVREYRVNADRTSGMALVYSWREEYGWGLDISMPVSGEASARLELDFGGTDLPGCVVWFDEDLVLERWREGLVGDLLSKRRRPAPVLDGQ